MGSKSSKQRNSAASASAAPPRVPTLDDEPDVVLAPLASTLTFVSYNVWFEMLERDLRFAHLADTIVAEDPSFVCLQECNAWFRRQWDAHPLLSTRYRGAWPPDNFVFSYFTTVLVRVVPDAPADAPRSHVTVVREYFGDADTMQGRDLTYVALPTHGIIVATVHLESPVNAPAAVRRDAQGLRVIRALADLAAAGNSVWLMGDTNGDANEDVATSPLNAALVPHTEDAWVALHGDDPGYTEDTDVNAMRAAFRDEVKFCRIDRILRITAADPPDTPPWAVTDTRRLGLTPIGASQVTAIPIFISDHFGLVASYVRTDPTDSTPAPSA